jgi:hypothetical protein
MFHREAKVLKDNNMVQIHFNNRPGAGGAWLDTVDFSDGAIECDIKGKEPAAQWVKDLEPKYRLIFDRRAPLTNRIVLEFLEGEA